MRCVGVVLRGWKEAVSRELEALGPKPCVSRGVPLEFNGCALWAKDKVTCSFNSPNVLPKQGILSSAGPAMTPHTAVDLADANQTVGDWRKGRLD